MTLATRGEMIAATMSDELPKRTERLGVCDIVLAGLGRRIGIEEEDILTLANLVDDSDKELAARIRSACFAPENGARYDFTEDEEIVARNALSSAEDKLTSDLSALLTLLRKAHP